MAPPLSTWIFQARPDRYDLREAMAVGKPIRWHFRRKEDQKHAARYLRQVKENDRVYFWQAGEEAGIYGRGMITKVAEDEVVTEPIEPIEPHLPKDEIQRIPELETMLILRMPAGTIFEVDEKEAPLLDKLVDDWIDSHPKLEKKGADPYAKDDDIKEAPEEDAIEYRPQRLVNDIPNGPDLLNIRSEINALADAIALKDVEPPLVVGILGGWGSGKSFVLHLLTQRLAEIRRQPLPDGDAFPYIGHPYVIRFDAWTYAKANLWASLMQRIFFELNRQIGLEREIIEKLGISPLEDSEVWHILYGLDEREREVFLRTEAGRKALSVAANLDHGEDVNQTLWKVLSDERRKEQESLKNAESELAAKKSQLESRRFELQSEVDNVLQGRAKEQAMDFLIDEVCSAFGCKPEDLDAGKVDVEQLLEHARSYNRRLASPQKLGIAVLTGLLVLFALWVRDTDMPELKEIMASVVSSISAFWFCIRRGVHWLDEKRVQYQERMEAARSNLEELRESVYQDVLSSEWEKSEDNENSLPALEREIQELEAKVEKRRMNVGITATHTSLLDFVNDRLNSGYYEQRLGLLHQVHLDLKELSETLLNSAGREIDGQTLFPRGKPRVVLVIDDLDRCPPDRVVEVLEAAQLLVKTELFVVVLAMDVRYITKALEKVYRGVLVHHGDPSGLDYIEKIVQIPYRVRPVQHDSVAQFVQAQMEMEEPQEQDSQPDATGRTDEVVDEEDDVVITEDGAKEVVNAPLPSEVQKFSAAEHELLTRCCQAVGVSPRSVKRLVNVFKLFKIIWFRQSDRCEPDEATKTAMLFLLTLAARYPSAMRELFIELEYVYLHGEDSDTKLRDWVLKHCGDHKSCTSDPTEWQWVEKVLQPDGIIADSVTLKSLGEHNARLVSSFSFLGEEKEDGQALLRDGSA